MIIIKISFSFIMEIKGMGWLNDAETELPYDKPTYFYQFCAFAGMDRKHVVRECLFKSPGKYLSIKTHKITPQDYRTLLKKMRDKVEDLIWQYLEGGLMKQAGLGTHSRDTGSSEIFKTTISTNLTSIDKCLWLVFFRVD